MEKTNIKKRKLVSYSKWGFIFIAPFFIAFILFSLFPLISTFYNSFFENYDIGLETVGPNFVGLENFKTIFQDDSLFTYLGNTFIIWVLGFVPQIILSLLFASWFTNLRLKLKATGFFKTVIYMPNLIMAAAFAMLFFDIFSDAGPISSILLLMGLI